MRARVSSYISPHFFEVHHHHHPLLIPPLLDILKCSPLQQLMLVMRTLQKLCLCAAVGGVAEG